MLEASLWKHCRTSDHLPSLPKREMEEPQTANLILVGARKWGVLMDYLPAYPQPAEDSHVASMNANRGTTVCEMVLYKLKGSFILYSVEVCMCKAHW